MNEGQKTGIYGIAALVMLIVAIIISRPPSTETDTDSMVGRPLFSDFKDALTASTLKITTFNEEQGELAKFEVAKDPKTGVWSLPSRSNYPADAAEQMKDAATALVDLKVLDVVSETAEDHAKMGVLEPNIETLQAGDEGVGRLVTLKGENNTTLASVIIGKPVKGSTGKRYVRKPGQDPVYEVTLDDKPLSTKFEDWIEKDLLQLSSIDINNVDIQNYDASLELAGQLALERHYDAKLSIDSGNNWKIDSLVVYGDQGEPQETKLADGEKPATTKLNALKNALDDLKIVDVASKPKGMSENLKADKDLVSDQKAVMSLANLGFFPIQEGDILSANGEMIVTLKDGVQYVLRFGNVKGIEAASKDVTDESKAGKKPEVAGSNRYLLVTTRVDEAKFPAPDLASIPKTVEELEAMDAAKAKAAAPPEKPAAPATLDAPAAAETDAKPQIKKEAAAVQPAADKSEEEPKPEVPAGEAVKESAEATKGDASNAEDQAAEKVTASGEGEQSGSGEARGSGQGQDAAAKAQEPTFTEPAAAELNEPTGTPSDAQAATAVVKPAEAQPAESKAETAEEKQERLEAEQEKLTKENQRKLDERKDKIEAARRRVRELNGRFADWYYVIPEATYRNLRLSRDELSEKPVTATSSATKPVDDAAQSPTLELPNFGN